MLRAFPRYLLRLYPSQIRRAIGEEMEEVFLHIDMETRHTAAWPEDVAAALDQRIAADASLPWEPSLSGSMSLR